MSKNEEYKITPSGLGLSSVLTIIFVVLKLCGLIDWSWLWVLSPTWISIGLTVVLILILFVCVKISNWMDKRNK